MKIIQNYLIKITLSDEKYNQFICLDRMEKLKSGDIRVHSGVNETRGRILSYAMMILGNKSEAKRLDKQGFKISESELARVRMWAKSIDKDPAWIHSQVRKYKELMEYIFNAHKCYRHRFDDIDGIIIEILQPEKMPNQIGLCDYQYEPTI